MTDTAFNRVCDALNTAGSTTRGNDTQRTARCPAHDDNTPSLSITRADDRVLLKCHAGCATDTILGQLQLSPADLFDTPPTNGHAKSEVVAEYQYTDEHGTVLYVKERRQPKDFRLKCPTGTGGWEYKLGDARRVLYRLPGVIAAIAQGRHVYVVEGEQDADTLHRRGIAATCNHEGAAKPGQTTKWRAEYGDTLKGAHVRVVADRDEAGRAHAQAIYDDLTGKAATIEVYEAAEGKDVTDHLQAGRTLDDLVYIDLTAEQHEWDAVQLMHQNFPDRAWPIPDIIPPGLGMLSAPPKVGKSFWVLNVAVAVATGRPALSTFPTEQGDVLYLALEDGAQRVKDRLNLLPDAKRLRPGGLTVRTVAPRLDNGGFDVLTDWIKAHEGRARLVIVDVFQAMRASTDGHGKGNAYVEDYEALRGLRTLANRHGVGVLVVHHNNKTKSEDPLMMLSGSTGLSGVVDYVAVIKRDRKEARGIVFVVGRDVEDIELVMDFEGGRWTVSDYPASLLRSTGVSRRAVYDELTSHPDGCLIVDLEQATGLSVGAIGKALERLGKERLVERLNSSAPGHPVRWRVLPNKGVSCVSCVSPLSPVSPLSNRTHDTHDTHDKQDTQDTHDSSLRVGVCGECGWPYDSLAHENCGA